MAYHVKAEGKTSIDKVGGCIEGFVGGIQEVIANCFDDYKINSHSLDGKSFKKSYDLKGDELIAAEGTYRRLTQDECYVSVNLMFDGRKISSKKHKVVLQMIEYLKGLGLKPEYSVVSTEKTRKGALKFWADRNSKHRIRRSFEQEAEE